MSYYYTLAHFSIPFIFINFQIKISVTTIFMKLLYNVKFAPDPFGRNESAVSVFKKTFDF